MPKKTEQRVGRTFEISLEEQPEFEGRISAFLFDNGGNLREEVRVSEGRASFTSNDHDLAHGRLFIAPVLDNASGVKEKPSIRMMERLAAYEPVISYRGKFLDVIRVPGSIIELWPICFCWIRGHVIKSGSMLPVCNARVHICEVDRIWRWLIRIPDVEILRFRDDLLKEFERPLRRRPPWPPDPPGPFQVIGKGLINLKYDYEASHRDVSLQMAEGFPDSSGGNGSAAVSSKSTSVPDEFVASLSSTSAAIVRETLIAHVHLVFPWLCLLRPRWWKYRCDEVAVVDTDALGRFHALMWYSCRGDRPDLYFWVEYNIGGALVTVYRPALPCHTYWNYGCGRDVTILISDNRVPACNSGPDLPGCQVQILSIGRGVSLSEIHGPGSVPGEEGLTTGNEPFGGKIEPRVWFSRTALREDKNILYYRWSYRKCGNASGGDIAEPLRGPWIPITRTVVRHYAVPVLGGVSHIPVTLGPRTIGTEGNLFEIRPMAVPAGGIEWTVVDEREDLASAHFETSALGTGDTACEKAADAAGKYELKLELFKDTGSLVDWTTEGIDIQITNVAAPFGTDTVTGASATNYHKVLDGAGHTMGFRMVLRVDNNCCEAKVEPVEGVGLVAAECGFLEFVPGASATLRFRAFHPNNLADFSFSLVRGVSVQVNEASAEGQTGNSPISTLLPNPHPLVHLPNAYSLDAGGRYGETFRVSCLLGPCPRAAFSEALHVKTRATDGYGRLWHLDAFAHDGFALTPPH